MGAKAARWTLSGIALLTCGLLSFVALRMEMLRLSYAIQDQNRELKESHEYLRTLRFEVSEKKALANLDLLSESLSRPLAQPLRVNHLIIQDQLQAPAAKDLVFPQNFFSLFSMVPEAFAKADERKS